MSTERVPPHLRDTPSVDDATNDESIVLVSDASTADLRIFLRDHLVYLFLAAGLAVVALIIPSSAWHLSLLRSALFLAAFGFGGIRLLQINGILAEIRKRGEAAGDPDQP